MHDIVFALVIIMIMQSQNIIIRMASLSRGIAHGVEESDCCKQYLHSLDPLGRLLCALIISLVVYTKQLINIQINMEKGLGMILVCGYFSNKFMSPAVC